MYISLSDIFSIHCCQDGVGHNITGGPSRLIPSVHMLISRLKTLSLFAYIAEHESPRPVNPHLVLCPLSVLSAWIAVSPRHLKLRSIDQELIDSTGGSALGSIVENASFPWCYCRTHAVKRADPDRRHRIRHLRCDIRVLRR